MANEGDLLFDSGGTWRVYRHGRNLLYQFRPPLGDGAPARGVLIDEHRRRGRLFFRPPYDRRRGFALSYPLDELLFQHHFARSGGLVVHACGVAWRGRALAFCGPSGAGKSTTARLWLRHQPDATILSDDRLVLRRHGEKWQAHGTPWHGSARLASAHQRALSAVFFLEHGPKTVLVKLDRAEAAARLLAVAFPPLWEREGVAATLRGAARVAGALPAFVLRFQKDLSAVTTVRQVLGTLP
ncbi:MAG TPA: hypothetical protein VF076_06065, partial [Acidimicrobiales bacterium]